MTTDANDSIMALRARQLADAARLLNLSNDLCERVLQDSGDCVDFRLVRLQIDSAQIAKSQR